MYLLVLLAFNLVSLCRASQDPRVTINQGTIVGRTLTTVGSSKSYHSFQGIPYAEPPLEDLRFMPPEPHSGWNDILYAVNDTKKCPQKDALFDNYPHGDEDCLVLNVYTPANFSERVNLPIMFWIHGGGFASGSSSTYMFGPDYFMEENVILVTINYRLGVLGFLNLNDDVVMGNMGLKDVVLALKWVRDNIKHFKGDKDRVTIFGNNAGGAIVSLLMQSSAADGLFSKAVCQSGVSKLPQLFNSKERERAFTLAKLLNKDPPNSAALLKAFKKFTPFDFVKAAPRTFDSTEVRDAQKNILPFGPSVESSNNEEAFLTKTPEEVYSNKDVPNKNVPMMIGFNSRESIVYLRTLINNPEILDKLNYNFQFSLPFRGLEFAYNSQTYKEVSELIRKFYFKDGIIERSAIENFVDYVSDEIFYPIAKTIEEHLKIFIAPIYYYQFSYEGSLNFYKSAVLNDTNSISGASNGDEICYLFKCNALDSIYERIHEKEAEAKDLLVIKKMVRMWTNFAKYGNPTPIEDETLNNVNWSPTNSKNYQYLKIDSDLKMDENPKQKNVAFWDEIYKKYSQTEESPNRLRNEL